MAKCVRCNQTLTSPASIRRGMGARCAMLEVLARATDDAALRTALSDLLTDVLAEGDTAAAAEIGEHLRQVARFPLYQVPNPLELGRAVEWHLTTGRKAAPVPADLEALAWGLVYYGQTGRPLAQVLRRTMPGASRAEVWQALARLAQVVEEVRPLIAGSVGEVA